MTKIEQGAVVGNWRHNFFPGERPFGRQRTLDISTGTEPATEEGWESWERAPATLRSARTINFVPSDDPEYIGVAHVEFIGENLPVYPDSIVEISFDDDRYTHTGETEGYWYEPTLLMAKVRMKSGTPDGPVTVTINGASVRWLPDWNSVAPVLKFVRHGDVHPDRPLDVLYWGEVFYLEADYPTEQMMQAQDFLVGPVVDPNQSVTLLKHPDRPKVYRSQPILLLKPGEQPPTDAELAARRPRPERSVDGPVGICPWCEHGNEYRARDRDYRKTPDSRTISRARGAGGCGCSPACAPVPGGTEGRAGLLPRQPGGF